MIIAIVMNAMPQINANRLMFPVKNENAESEFLFTEIKSIREQMNNQKSKKMGKREKKTRKENLIALILPIHR